VFDIIIVQRWNIALGISDKNMFMIGDAIIYDICYTLNFMPAVLLTSKLCPKEIESTTYALLAGFQNFGQQVFVCGRESARERKGGLLCEREKERERERASEREREREKERLSEKERRE
jgi:hypothetical protein